MAGGPLPPSLFIGGGKSVASLRKSRQKRLKATGGQEELTVLDLSDHPAGLGL